jgi:hypothetical protein
MGLELLRDLLGIFYPNGVEGERGVEGESVPAIPSLKVVEKLAAMDGRPWAKIEKGEKPISPRALVHMLSPYKVAPKLIYQNGQKFYGYRIEQFWSAWYDGLHPWELPQWLVLNGPPSEIALQGAESAYHEPSWDRNAPKPAAPAVEIPPEHLVLFRS